MTKTKILEVDCSTNKVSISELIYNEGLKNGKVELNNITSLYPDMNIIKYLEKIAGYQIMGIIIGKDDTRKNIRKLIRLLFIKIKITKIYN